jgi:HAD superfamily hydrolase (TIGR01509 family)
VLQRDHLRGVFDYISAKVHPLDSFDAYCAEFHTRMTGAWIAARTNYRAPNVGSLLVETAVALGAPAASLDARRCLDSYHWGALPGTAAFPDVTATLALLRTHGIKFGIVTNAPQPMWLRDLEMQAHGLYDFFPDCRISAADVGYLKPHPAIFQTALHCLGIQPQETVFVGDDLEADVGGAQAAGMRAVLRQLPHRPIGAYAEIVPDAAINTLDELPAILDEWHPGWRKS